MLIGGYFIGCIGNYIDVNNAIHNLFIMEATQQNILSALYNFFEQNKDQTIGDKEIAKASSLDIERVRVCLKDLQKKGYIKLEDAACLSNPEYYIVMSMTAEGRLVVKDNQ